MWGYGKKLVDAWQNSALKLQFWSRMIDRLNSGWITGSGSDP